MRLLAVVEHDALDRPAAAVALRDAFAAFGPEDFTPVPLLLADAGTEAAFEAQAGEIERLRADLAQSQAETRKARADAVAAFALAEAEETRRREAEAALERVRRNVAPAAVARAPRRESFGAWLRRRRAEAGLTQAEMADEAGVSQGAISTYEREVLPPSPEYRARIEAALAGCVPVAERV